MLPVAEEGARVLRCASVPEDKSARPADSGIPTAPVGELQQFAPARKHFPTAISIRHWTVMVMMALEGGSMTVPESLKLLAHALFTALIQ